MAIVLAGTFSKLGDLSGAAGAAKVKENLNVGTIGHVDHGKTTLTTAITQTLAKQVRLSSQDSLPKRWRASPRVARS